MPIQVKLFATLRRYRPDLYPGEPFEVEVPQGSTIDDLVARLGIRENEVKVAFVDGQARAGAYRLRAGDSVGIFPPVGGG